MNTTKVHAGASVVVFGLGAVGLAVVQAAKMVGAGRIIAVDVNPEKFDAAKVRRKFNLKKSIGHRFVVVVKADSYSSRPEFIFDSLHFEGQLYVFVCFSHALSCASSVL